MRKLVDCSVLLFEAQSGKYYHLLSNLYCIVTYHGIRTFSL
jgi:hypothetical protein